jgi:hypothetical protein
MKRENFPQASISPLDTKLLEWKLWDIGALALNTSIHPFVSFQVHVFPALPRTGGGPALALKEILCHSHVVAISAVTAVASIASRRHMKNLYNKQSEEK